jgi:cytochrome P450
MWMLNNAKEDEAILAKMASRQLILTLASIHATSMAVSHALYDLCAHPEWFEPLRREIEELL